MRNDNTPGVPPLTNGLMIANNEGGFKKVNSGEVAGFNGDATFRRVRVDPKLLSTGLRPVQLLVKAISIITYSSGDGKTDPPTAAAGGLATLEAQGFYQPIWAGPGGDFGFMSVVDDTQIFEYMLIMRRLSEDEQTEGK